MARKGMSAHPGESAREYAERRIREMIIAMELLPGSLVSENELSQTLEVSRTPVREALTNLSKVKMVEILPQRGCRIAYIDYGLVEEARFVREALETAVIQRVCERITPVDEELLRQNLYLQRLTLNRENGNVFSLMDLDNEFHAMLFRIAGMENAYVLMSGIQIHFDRVRRLALQVIRDTKIIQDHERIAEALGRKDAQAAREAMLVHLNRVSVDRDQIRQTYPDFFRE